MNRRQVFYTVLTLIALILIPYLGAYFCYDGDITGAKPGYFDFPPQKRPEKPGANLLALIICVIIFLVLLSLYLFPSLLGFKKQGAKIANEVTRFKFPKWFWIGLITWLFTLSLWIIRTSEPQWYLNWSFIPLCWGFILFLDGLVYYFNQGESLISTKPTEVISMGLVSISGWLIFEYLNLFIEHNWFYPKASLHTHDGFIIYAIFGSSAFIPMAYEWYHLIRKLKVFEFRFKYGPKIIMPKWLKIVLLIISVFGMFITPYFPNELFFLLWVAPVVVLSLILSLMNIWTPFTPIKNNGDWTYLLVFALTFLIQGFLLEWWNYLSATKMGDGTIISFNACYWQYCVPLVSKYHIFEMPFFGYLGYLLFSIHCSVWWILFSHLTGFSTNFSLNKDFK